MQGEDPECAVTFASSVSESEEEEEGVGGPSTPPRPTLRLDLSQQNNNYS